MTSPFQSRCSLTILPAVLVLRCRYFNGGTRDPEKFVATRRHYGRAESDHNNPLRHDYPQSAHANSRYVSAPLQRWMPPLMSDSHRGVESPEKACRPMITIAHFSRTPFGLVPSLYRALPGYFGLSYHRTHFMTLWTVSLPLNILDLTRTYTCHPVLDLDYRTSWTRHTNVFTLITTFLHASS